MIDRVDYRYYTVDLLTNVTLAEIPFSSVNWGRAVRRAGEFSGSVQVIAANDHLNLYDNTMPGRTALYVVRNGVCVWGGIIWSRSYDPLGRTLSISGAEFPSYFYHRFVWKTLTRMFTSSDRILIDSFSITSGQMTVTTRGGLPHNLNDRDNVLISGIATLNPDLEGVFTVVSIVSDTSFILDTSDIADTASTTTTATRFQKVTDNYTFVRTLLNYMASDFAGLLIARVEPAIPGKNRVLSIIQSERLNKIARLVTDTPHELIPGQEVIVKDLSDDFDGTDTQTVTSVRSGLSFEYSNAANSSGTALSDAAMTTEAGYRTYGITGFSAKSFKDTSTVPNKRYTDVTLTLDAAHSAAIGDEVIVDVNTPTPQLTTDFQIFDSVETIRTVPDVNILTYRHNNPGGSDTGWYLQRNVTHNGLVYSAGVWTVTLAVDTAHTYQKGADIKVEGLIPCFNGEYTIASVTPVPTQVTYTISRQFNILGVRCKGGVVTLTTDGVHRMVAGESIQIYNYGSASNNNQFGGVEFIIDTVASNKITFRKQSTVSRVGSWTKNSTSIVVDDGSGIIAGMFVEAGSGMPTDAKVVSRVGTTVTIDKPTTAAATSVTKLTSGSTPSASPTITLANVTGIKVGMSVQAAGVDSVITSISSNTITIRDATTAIISTSTSLSFKWPVLFHNKYPQSDKTLGKSVAPTAYVRCVSNITYTDINTANDETITRTNMVNVSSGGTVTLGPRVYAATYGGFAYNSDIDLGFMEESDSGGTADRAIYTASEMMSVGQILEAVSAGSDGFEYRVDCNYDESSGSFTRTFVVSGYDIPEDLEPGEARTLESLGADKLVFEYPGNISSFGLDESAEEAATRMWVVGASGNSGEGVEQPRAGATKTSMLEDGWPLLDATEQMEDQSGTLALYKQAESFLEESLPPIDTLDVKVNGSLDPQVGTYKPGDWCSLVFDDLYMQMRLASSQEPRDNIMVRKIMGYKVTVPDSFGIPESVDLDLMRDSEVDGVGNQQA